MKMKRQLHILPAAISSQYLCIYHTEKSVYLCRRLYFRMMYKMFPSFRSTYGVMLISAMRIQNIYSILPPFTWCMKQVFCIPMNLLHTYIGRKYAKLRKEIKIFYFHNEEKQKEKRVYSINLKYTQLPNSCPCYMNYFS